VEKKVMLKCVKCEVHHNMHIKRTNGKPDSTNYSRLLYIQSNVKLFTPTPSWSTE
jgi:hypothetical protein